MSTITKEWLQQKISDMEATRDDIPFGLDEDDSNTLAALRIALASLEAEPVHQFIYNNPYEEGYTEWLDCNKDYFNGVPEDCRRILYIAPPAPVSVPDDVIAAMQKVARIRLDLNDFDGDKRGILDCLSEAEEALIEVVNRRAAMLQGAEPVTSAYKLPDGWVACSERMPKFGDYLVTDGKDFDVQMFNGEQFIPGFVWEDNITHWMPLPAAPQQEVK